MSLSTNFILSNTDVGFWTNSEIFPYQIHYIPTVNCGDFSHLPAVVIRMSLPPSYKSLLGEVLCDLLRSSDRSWAERLRLVSCVQSPTRPGAGSATDVSRLNDTGPHSSESSLNGERTGASCRVSLDWSVVGGEAKCKGQHSSLVK